MRVGNAKAGVFPFVCPLGKIQSPEKRFPGHLENPSRRKTLVLPTWKIPSARNSLSPAIRKIQMGKKRLFQPPGKFPVGKTGVSRPPRKLPPGKTSVPRPSAKTPAHKLRHSRPPVGFRWAKFLPPARPESSNRQNASPTRESQSDTGGLAEISRWCSEHRERKPPDLVVPKKHAPRQGRRNAGPHFPPPHPGRMPEWATIRWFRCAPPPANFHGPSGTGGSSADYCFTRSSSITTGLRSGFISAEANDRTSCSVKLPVRRKLPPAIPPST